MAVVHFDRHLWVRTAVLTLLLTWPLILFGRPAYFSDSLSYYKGGKVAVMFAVGKITSQLHLAASQSPTPSANVKANPGAAPDDTVGVRSIPYSVVAYLLSPPDGEMIVLGIAQAAIAALTIAIVVLALGLTGFWRFTLLAVALAVVTPLTGFAQFASPDIFAGLAICVIALLATHFNHLSVGIRLALFTIGGFAAASHPSHLPLAAGMGLLGAGYIVLTRASKDHQLRMIVGVFAPVALGIVLTVVSGFVAFDELSLAPKRWPLALAKSVADGPARWYLEKNCSRLHYAVCEVFDNDIPATVFEFLWSPRGLRYRATPAQMDRIRAEEPEIVLQAAQNYPYAEATLTLNKIVRQLMLFSPRMYFNQRLWLDASGKPYLETIGEVHSRLLDTLPTLSIISALLAFGWACWRFPVLRLEDRAMLLLVIAGILGNAIICAVFAGVTDRYQGRVIWVLPMVCMAMMLRSENQAERTVELLNKPSVSLS
jgi:hypothetical protein